MRHSLQTLFFMLMVGFAIVAGYAVASFGTRDAGGSLAIAIAGMVAGITLAWLWRVDWWQFGLRFRLWLIAQKPRAWWLFWGVVSILVLLFY